MLMLTECMGSLEYTHEPKRLSEGQDHTEKSPSGDRRTLDIGHWTLDVGWHLGHCQNAFQMSSVPLYPYLKIQRARWYHLKASRSCCQGQGTFSGSWLLPRIS